MDDSKITLTIGKQKNIALIAHDGKKAEIIAWCEEHKEELKKHFLCGTGTTARMITDRTGLPVRGYNSGPLGGDQQVGAKVVEGKIDLIIFFSDPLTAQRHCFVSHRSMTFRSPTTRRRLTLSSHRISSTRNTIMM